MELRLQIKEEICPVILFLAIEKKKRKKRKKKKKRHA